MTTHAAWFVDSQASGLCCLSRRFGVWGHDLGLSCDARLMVCVSTSCHFNPSPRAHTNRPRKTNNITDSNDFFHCNPILQQSAFSRQKIRHGFNTTSTSLGRSLGCLFFASAIFPYLRAGVAGTAAGSGGGGVLVLMAVLPIVHLLTLATLDALSRAPFLKVRAVIFLAPCKV